MKYLFWFIYVITAASAQQFTRITNGPPVTDGGDSRSVNWIDYDGDGDLDLFVSNGPPGGQKNFFYENTGSGNFIKISGIAITEDSTSSDGSTWGDFDNDGYADLFVANWYNQSNLLYKNNGDKTFTKITTSVVSSDNGYSETGSWGDYDNDGYLDLYVCNSEGTRKNFLYHNNQDGSFSKITDGPQSTEAFYSRNADWIDYDGDGDADLFVTNERNQSENIYRNEGNGIFSNVSLQGVTPSGGNSTSSNWEDIDNDGDWDIFVANYNNQKNFLFINNGDGTYTKTTQGPVVNDPANSFGSCFGDVDNDGDADLFVTNAFTGTAKTINYMYYNNGDGTFTRDDNFSNADSGWAYGCAFGDYDRDGYLDLFVAKCFNASENNALYKNNGGSNNWILINLKGKKSNYSAIGAVVKLKSEINGNQLWQMRRLTGQDGYCGQTLQLHFGLNRSAQVDSLIIKWPSGIQQTLINIPVNQSLIIEEDTTLSSAEPGANNPEGFRLYQNYPNPLNPGTTIKYMIPEPGEINIKLYDILGNELMVLYNGFKPAGEYEIKFTPFDLPSGIYFYQMRSGKYSEIKKMTILK